jgi:hypothetical protein
MNGEKFTPGMWEADVDPHGDSYVLAVRSDGQGCHAISYPAYDAQTKDDRVANCRLIAAAPDLYFALKEIVQHIDEHGDDLDQWVMAEVIAGARLALWKARGEAK